jgi:hypothetical protein
MLVAFMVDDYFGQRVSTSRPLRGLTAVGSIGAGLTETGGNDLLVDALGNACVPVCLAIPPAHWSVAQAAVAGIDCNTRTVSSYGEGWGSCWVVQEIDAPGLSCDDAAS